MESARPFPTLVRNIFRFLWAIILLISCNGNISATEKIGAGNNQKLKVVASTSIIYDIVRQVGRDSIELDVLLPIGKDPHSFEPAPQDVALLSDADILFINGVGLETFLAPLLESSGGDFTIVDLSRDLELIKSEEHSEDDGTDDWRGYDPHVWMDPNNVILWVEQISASLSEFDALNSSLYDVRAEEYINELIALDHWIVDQVKQIPPENRKLITDHMVFGYFAQRYGFIQIGAVLPSFDTQSQPSAQEIAALEDAIRKEEIKAIFVGISVNPNLSRRIAEDTGITLVFVQTESLTEPGGITESYIELMRYDVDAIVTALK